MSFDEKAKDWDKDPKKVERATIFAREIMNILGNKELKSALEFGSGTGLVSFQLKNSFSSIYLADTSKGMIEVLQAKIKTEKLTSFYPLLITDTKDLLSHPKTDVIFTLLTLHHVKDIDEAFMVFGSLIKKGGYLFIGDLVTENGSFHTSDPQFDGHFGFDTEVLKEKLGREGFECIENKIFHSVERENNSVVKNYPLFILSCKKN
jgi:ubiquinone/menaquinone biosynthesis C-methylase UbiE